MSSEEKYEGVISGLLGSQGVGHAVLPIHLLPSKYRVIPLRENPKLDLTSFFGNIPNM